MWIERKKPWMWDRVPRLSPDVGSVPVNGTSPPCGKNRHNSSTGLSTENTRLKSNPHFGEHPNLCPYMGVWNYRYFLPTSDFSTVRGTYPQKIASYPHTPCPDKGYGGIPFHYIWQFHSGFGDPEQQKLEHGQELIHKQRFRVTENRHRIAHVNIQEGAQRCQLLADIPDHERLIPVAPLIRLHPGSVQTERPA
jgi:hypothetical protein